LSDAVVLASEVSSAHRFERNLFYATCGIYSFGPLVLNSNTFSSTNSYCSDVIAQDSLVASFNSFFPDTENLVVLGPVSADIRNNYWGGLSDADVPARITDNYDDLNIQGTATFLPTLATPSPDAPATDKTYFP